MTNCSDNIESRPKIKWLYRTESMIFQNRIYNKKSNNAMRLPDKKLSMVTRIIIYQVVTLDFLSARLTALDHINLDLQMVPWRNLRPCLDQLSTNFLLGNNAVNQREQILLEQRKRVRDHADRKVWVTFCKEGIHKYPAATRLLTALWTVLIEMLALVAIVAWEGQASVPSSEAWSAMINNTIFSTVGKSARQHSDINRMLIHLPHFLVGNSVHL